MNTSTDSDRKNLIFYLGLQSDIHPTLLDIQSNSLCVHDLVWAANKHFRSSSIFLVFVTEIKVLPQPPTHTLSQFTLLHNLITLFLKFPFNITLISPPPGNCNHSITKHITFSSTALSIHRSGHPVIQHYITYTNNEMPLKKLRHNIILSFLLTLPNCCIPRGSSYKTLHILFFRNLDCKSRPL